jgi:DNA gyrase/topoisomerase IV subunit B
MFLDCESPDCGEIFVVEGRDACNSLRHIRNRQTQAVIAMQGKIPNPVRSTNKKKLFGNPHIQSLLNAIEASDTDMRFARLIILCDADADGLHARTLLMLFFCLHYAELVYQQRIFAINPPLFRIRTASGKTQYARSRAQLQSIEADNQRNGNTTEISHYKGIASMPAEVLSATCIKKESRTILPVTRGDGAALLSSLPQGAVRS